MADEKKHKSGFTLLKEKLAKAEAEKAKLQNQLAQALSERNNFSAQLDRAKTEIHNLKIDCNEKQSTIEMQGTKISTLTADLSVAQGNEEEWKRKYNEAIAHIPFWRRWLHGLQKQ